MSNFDSATNLTRNLYAIVLNSKDDAPNLPKNDMEEIKKNSSDSESKKDNKEVIVTIDENGIFDRAVALDLPARNYVALLKGPKHNVFIAEAIQNENGLKVYSYDVEKEKVTDYASGVSQMVASDVLFVV